MMNPLKNKQQGIVLFIAMIALVVMSLAAVALIRSVDTNTKIAGNLAFKQSALTSADRGIETAISWLEIATALNDSVATNAYFAVYGDLDGDGSKESVDGNLDEMTTLKDDDTWDNYSAVATGDGINDDGTEDDGKGNTIRYIIERMCELEGEPAKDTTNKCLFGAADSGGNGRGDLSNDEITVLDIGGSSINPMYRVTVRVTGPKNTTSYTQVYVF